MGAWNLNSIWAHLKNDMRTARTFLRVRGAASPQRWSTNSRRRPSANRPGSLVPPESARQHLSCRSTISKGLGAVAPRLSEEFGALVYVSDSID